jgi:hypothetical protein
MESIIIPILRGIMYMLTQIRIIPIIQDILPMAEAA